MALKAGTLADTFLSDSMVGAIEAAFRAHWHEVMGSEAELPDEINPQMKLVFVAIAKGVVRHLKENADSFVVKESEHNDGEHDHNITIETE